MHTMMTAALAGLVLLSASPGQAEVGGRQVDLVARDGVKLKATYLAATRPGPGVLLLHQCGDGGRRSWDSLATLLAARGFHVLALDYRGFGESGDERFETATRDVRRAQLAKWAGDFDAAFEYLTAQPAVDSKRVAAAGASCGVENSAQLAVRHPEVKALVLLSGSPDQAGLDHIRSAELPIFAASSEDDYGFVPYMRWLVRFSGHPGKKLVEYKNAGHGTDMFRAEKDLAPMIADWLTTSLGNTSGAPSTGTTKAAKPDPMLEFWSVLTGPDGTTRALRLLKDARKRDPKAILFPERAVLTLGYEHIRKGEARKAADVLELGAEAYPQSPYVAITLGRAYVDAGERTKALEQTQRALQLLATDRSLDPEARDAIRQQAEERLRELKG